RAGAWGGFGVWRPLLALVAVAAIVPQVVVLAAGIHLRNSQEAAAAGNGARAKREALAAQAVEPWDSAPYLQLALVDEGLKEYDAAKAAIDAAIRRAPRDWQLWLAAVRIDGERGDLAAASRDLAQARLLNPNAPILQGGS
ncbi:MAG TPA: hypothetical protein VE995_09130, partial [Gaiellaceae bacterium]|nr:hypothetical protein [Gaiellaceae bacterium]